MVVDAMSRNDRFAMFVREKALVAAALRETTSMYNEVLAWS